MEYHKDRFEDYSLLVFKEKKLVALLPANVSKTTVFSHQGLTYGGLVTAKSLRFEDTLHCFKAVLEFLNEQGIHTLELKQMPSIYTNSPSDELAYLLFLLNANLTRRDALSVINRNQKEQFSGSRLEGCKRAEKHGLLIKELHDFEAFWNEILIPNLQEKHQKTPVHSLEEIKKLKQRFPKNIRQFNVYHKDTLVAGTTIFETKQVAHAQYISGNADKNTLGSLDALYAYLIRDVFKEKAFIDFGMSNENDGKTVNNGLLFWKEGFGARTITQDFYSIKTANHIKLNTILI